MYKLRNVIEEVLEKIEQRAELEKLVAKDKAIIDLKEANAWVGNSAIDFKGIGATTDNMRKMAVRQHVIKNTPSSYDENLRKLHEVDSHIKFLYKIWETMIVLGVESIGIDEDNDDAGSSPGIE